MPLREEQRYGQACTDEQIRRAEPDDNRIFFDVGAHHQPKRHERGATEDDGKGGVPDEERLMRYRRLRCHHVIVAEHQHAVGVVHEKAHEAVQLHLVARDQVGRKAACRGQDRAYLHGDRVVKQEHT